MKTATEQGPDDALCDAMRAYQAGDASAFDRLYAGLSPILRRYLHGAARDAARVDDLIQETFLQLHRARRTYDPGRPVVPWALAIARHVFLMNCRTRKRKCEAETVEFDSVAHAVEGQSAAPDVDAAIIAREQVRHGLAGLTPGTRQAVVLHHVQGWSFREIGTRLGIRSGAAKLRASRGVNALRARLEPGKGDQQSDER